MKSLPKFLLLLSLLSNTLLAQQPPLTSTLILQESTSWAGTAIPYPAGTPEISAFIIELAPGAETGWHSHPVPSFGLILEGELEVETRDGQRRRLLAGEAVVETVDLPHNGINTGAVPMKLVVFYAGVQELPLTLVEGAAAE